MKYTLMERITLTISSVSLIGFLGYLVYRLYQNFIENPYITTKISVGLIILSFIAYCISIVLTTVLDKKLGIPKEND